MDSKKINQLATNVNPQTSDLTTIGDPITGQLKKITWLQVAHLIGAQAARDLQDVTDDGAVTTNAITTGGLTLSNLGDGVLKTNSSGLVGTYGYGLANGVATLDSGGKVPASQLPSSIMDYKGNWNAFTNTPTLVNGTGDNGDVYRCNVAGTVDFGAGAITFKVGDWAIYNGTIWEQSNNSDAVASVFGRTGTITAQEGDYNIGQLGDVTVSTPLTNDYLRYNGSAWVNTPFPTLLSSDKLVIAVRNNSGATINKGTVVYINGATAGYPTIAKAIATGDSTSAQTMGLVQDNISNNSNGYVVAYGQITGIDTSAFTAGTQLYLSPTVAGGFTSTKQYAPNHLVYVGVVTTQNAVNGVIEVRIQNGFELSELHDVSAQTPSNNDGIFYNSTTELWESKSIVTVLGYTPMANPMTTLGDIIFGGTSGNPNRLAGNITTTKQYLSQTGTGTDSASPVWSSIAGSDVTGAALTKSDDTNVTLTLGGNASTALLRAASLTLGWTGQLSIARGGTGASTAIAGFNALSPLTTLGDILYHDGTNNARLGGNTTATKRFLSQTGDGTISAAPIWSTISGSDITGAALTKTDDTNVTLTLGGTPATSLLRAASLTLGWTGQLSIARGGTGASTAAAAFDNLSPMTALGDLIYGGASGTRTRLAGNTTTTKRFLIQTGDGTISAAPSWGTISAGDIPALPYVDGTGNANYIVRWNDSNTIENSIVYDNGTNVIIGSTSDFFGKLQVRGQISTITSSGYGYTYYTAASANRQYFTIDYNSDVFSLLVGKGGTAAEPSLSLGVQNTAVINIKSNKNVGININPKGFNVDSSLEIGARGGMYDNNDNFAYVNNGYVDSSSQWKYKVSGLASIMGTNGGMFYFETAPSGTADANLSWTRRFEVGNTGTIKLNSYTTNGILKVTSSDGTVALAVAGTDYVVPSALSGYLPLTGGTLTGKLVVAAGAGEVHRAIELTTAGGDTTSLKVNYARFGSIDNILTTADITNNAWWNGTSWNVDDAALSAILYRQQVGANAAATLIRWYYSAPAANASFNQILSLNGDGNLITAGTVTVGSLPADSPSNAYVTSASGTLRYRTAAQVLSDIGAASSSSLSNYLPLAGGTLTGALGGTSAVFSSSVTATAFDSSNGIFRVYKSGTYYGGLGISSWAFSGDTNNDIALIAANNLKLSTNGSSSPSFIMDTSNNFSLTTSAPRYKLDLATLGDSANANYIGFGVVNGPADNTGTALGNGIIWKGNEVDYTKRSAGIIQIAQGNFLRAGLAFYTNNNADKTTDWSRRMYLSAQGVLYINNNTSTYGASAGYMLGVTGTVSQSLISIALSGQNLDSQGVVVGLSTSYGYFVVRDNIPLVFATNDTNRVYIGSTANQFDLMVGTASALQATANRGSVTINGSSSSILTLGVGNAVKAYFYTDNTPTTTIESSGANGNIIFATGNSNRLYLASNGFLGNVASPKSPLHFTGANSTEKKYDGIDDGLVLYYPMSETSGTTVYDRSVTGMNGTLTNGASTTTGILGNAITFTGSSQQYIAVSQPYTSVSLGTATTISMWIYQTSTTAQRYYLVDFRGNGSTSGASMYFLFDRTSSTAGTFTVGDNGAEVTSSSTTINTNEWYHIAATRSGSTWRIYVNGVEIKNGTSGSTSVTLNNSFRIGTYSGAGGGSEYYMTGRIDEFKLYNRTLSAMEIRSQYIEGEQDVIPYPISGGNIGIGYTTSQGSYKLQVNGSVQASSGFFDTSDIRLKNILNTIKSDNISAIEYTWKDGRNTKKHWGYSAQDVMKILPDAVAGSEDKFYTVNYNEVHTWKIAQLEKEIAYLKSKLN